MFKEQKDIHRKRESVFGTWRLDSAAYCPHTLVNQMTEKPPLLGFPIRLCWGSNKLMQLRAPWERYSKQSQLFADPITSTVAVEKGRPTGSRKSRTQTWVSSVVPNLLGTRHHALWNSFSMTGGLGSFWMIQTYYLIVTLFLLLLSTSSTSDHQGIRSSIRLGTPSQR